MQLKTKTTSEEKFVTLFNKSELDLILISLETSKEKLENTEGFEVYAEGCKVLLNKLYSLEKESCHS